MPDKLSKARELMNLVNQGLTRDDFTAAFKNVVEYVKRVDSNLTQAVSQLAQRLDAKADFSHQHLTKGLEDIKGQVDHVFVGERVSKIEQEHASRMSEVDAKMATVKSGDKGERGERGFPGKNGSPDLPEQIVEKLASLKGTQRLSIGHIHGLEEALAEGKKPRIADMTAIGVNRPQISYIDLSSQLNGVLTTFNTQSFQKVIQISLSSFPNILRPTIDFTTSQGPPSITFTGQIAANAATILAAGQTCIVLVLA